MALLPDPQATSNMGNNISVSGTAASPPLVNAAATVQGALNSAYQFTPAANLAFPNYTTQYPNTTTIFGGANALQRALVGLGQGVARAAPENQSAAANQAYQDFAFGPNTRYTPMASNLIGQNELGSIQALLKLLAASNFQLPGNPLTTTAPAQPGSIFTPGTSVAATPYPNANWSSFTAGPPDARELSLINEFVRRGYTPEQALTQIRVSAAPVAPVPMTSPAVSTRMSGSRTDPSLLARVNRTETQVGREMTTAERDQFYDTYASQTQQGVLPQTTSPATVAPVARPAVPLPGSPKPGGGVYTTADLIQYVQGVLPQGAAPASRQYSPAERDALTAASPTIAKLRSALGVGPGGYRPVLEGQILQAEQSLNRLLTDQEIQNLIQPVDSFTNQSFAERVAALTNAGLARTRTSYARTTENAPLPLPISPTTALGQGVSLGPAAERAYYEKTFGVGATMPIVGQPKPGGGVYTIADLIQYVQAAGRVMPAPAPAPAPAPTAAGATLVRGYDITAPGMTTPFHAYTENPRAEATQAVLADGGKSGSGLRGDLNGDGKVDNADYTLAGTLPTSRPPSGGEALGAPAKLGDAAQGRRRGVVGLALQTAAEAVGLGPLVASIVSMVGQELYDVATQRNATPEQKEAAARFAIKDEIRSAGKDPSSPESAAVVELLMDDLRSSNMQVTALDASGSRSVTTSIPGWSSPFRPTVPPPFETGEPRPPGPEDRPPGTIVDVTETGPIEDIGPPEPGEGLGGVTSTEEVHRGGDIPEVIDYTPEQIEAAQSRVPVPGSSPGPPAASSPAAPPSEPTLQTYLDIAAMTPLPPTGMLNESIPTWLRSYANANTLPSQLRTQTGPFGTPTSVGTGYAGDLSPLMTALASAAGGAAPAGAPNLFGAPTLQPTLQGLATGAAGRVPSLQDLIQMLAGEATAGGGTLGGAVNLPPTVPGEAAALNQLTGAPTAGYLPTATGAQMGAAAGANINPALAQILSQLPLSGLAPTSLDYQAIPAELQRQLLAAGNFVPGWANPAVGAGVIDPQVIANLRNVPRAAAGTNIQVPQIGAPGVGSAGTQDIQGLIAALSGFVPAAAISEVSPAAGNELLARLLNIAPSAAPTGVAPPTVAAPGVNLADVTGIQSQIQGLQGFQPGAANTMVMRGRENPVIDTLLSYNPQAANTQIAAPAVGGVAPIGAPTLAGGTFGGQAALLAGQLGAGGFGAPTAVPGTGLYGLGSIDVLNTLLGELQAQAYGQVTPAQQAAEEAQIALANRAVSQFLGNDPFQTGARGITGSPAAQGLAQRYRAEQMANVVDQLNVQRFNARQSALAQLPGVQNQLAQQALAGYQLGGALGGQQAGLQRQLLETLLGAAGQEAGLGLQAQQTTAQLGQQRNLTEAELAQQARTTSAQLGVQQALGGGQLGLGALQTAGGLAQSQAALQQRASEISAQLGVDQQTAMTQARLEAQQTAGGLGMQLAGQNQATQNLLAQLQVQTNLAQGQMGLEAGTTTAQLGLQQALANVGTQLAGAQTAAGLGQENLALQQRAREISAQLGVDQTTAMTQARLEATQAAGGLATQVSAQEQIRQNLIAQLQQEVGITGAELGLQAGVTGAQLDVQQALANAANQLTGYQAAGTLVLDEAALQQRAREISTQFGVDQTTAMNQARLEAMQQAQTGAGQIASLTQQGRQIATQQMLDRLTTMGAQGLTAAGQQQQGILAQQQLLLDAAQQSDALRLQANTAQQQGNMQAAQLLNERARQVENAALDQARIQQQGVGLQAEQRAQGVNQLLTLLRQQAETGLGAAQLAQQGELATRAQQQALITQAMQTQAGLLPDVQRTQLAKTEVQEAIRQQGFDNVMNLSQFLNGAAISREQLQQVSQTNALEAYAIQQRATEALGELLVQQQLANIAAENAARAGDSATSQSWKDYAVAIYTVAKGAYDLGLLKKIGLEPPKSSA